MTKQHPESTSVYLVFKIFSIGGYPRHLRSFAQRLKRMQLTCGSSATPHRPFQLSKELFVAVGTCPLEIPAEHLIIYYAKVADLTTMHQNGILKLYININICKWGWWNSSFSANDLALLLSSSSLKFHPHLPFLVSGLLFRFHCTLFGLLPRSSAHDQEQKPWAHGTLEISGCSKGQNLELPIFLPWWSLWKLWSIRRA